MKPSVLTIFAFVPTTLAQNNVPKECLPWAGWSCAYTVAWLFNCTLGDLNCLCAQFANFQAHGADITNGLSPFMGYPQCEPFEICPHEAYVTEMRRIVQTCEDYEDPTKPTPIFLSPEQSRLNTQLVGGMNVYLMPTVVPESLRSTYPYNISGTTASPTSWLASSRTSDEASVEATSVRETLTQTASRTYTTPPHSEATIDPSARFAASERRQRTFEIIMYVTIPVGVIAIIVLSWFCWRRRHNAKPGETGWGGARLGRSEDLEIVPDETGSEVRQGDGIGVWVKGRGQRQTSGVIDGRDGVMPTEPPPPYQPMGRE